MKSAFISLLAFLSSSEASNSQYFDNELPGILGYSKGEEPQDHYNYEPNKRGRDEGGSNRNEWTQFEYGFISGLMKMDSTP